MDLKETGIMEENEEGRRVIEIRENSGVVLVFLFLTLNIFHTLF